MSYDQYGLRHPDPSLDRVLDAKIAAVIKDMMFPVRCAHCRGVYDMGKVTVTARYTDCSVWRSPCCDLTVDSRPQGWKVRADYVELDRDGNEKRR